jgi:hypothetical protein
MSEYAVIPLDLSTARDAVEVVSRGKSITDVAVRALPAGATLALHFGEGKAAIPILGAGDALECCPAENDGLYATNVAQPGVIASVLVSFGGGVKASQ